MRIAIASDDGLEVAAHTGRCQGFVVYDVSGNAAVRVDYRRNGFTAHARGECSGGHEHGSQGIHHSHGELLDALSDCRVLVTRGLGPRLVADLAARGIEVAVCSEQVVEAAAEQYARGLLPKAAGGGCCCHRS